MSEGSIAATVNLEGSHEHPHLTKAIMALVASFPVLSVSVNHGSSTVYAVLLLLGLFLGWPAWRELNKEERRLVWGFLALFAVGALSLFGSDQLEEGFKRLERLLRMGSFGILLLLLIRHRGEIVRPFLVGVVIAGFSVGLQAAYGQFVLDKPEMAADGWLYNRLTFGNLSMLLFGVAVAGLVTPGLGRWLKVSAVLCSAAAAYAAVYSMTRGAWLFAPVLLVLLAVLLRPSKRLVGFGVLVSVLVLTTMLPSRIYDRVEEVASEVELFSEKPGRHTSTGARLNLWRNSYIIWTRDPLLGTGLGDFESDMHQLVRERVSFTKHVYGHAHSIYFDALATTGILGLISLVMAVVLLPGAYFFRQWREAVLPETRFGALVGLVTVAAFATFGLTEAWLARNPFVNSYTMFLVIAVAIIIRARRHGRVPSTAIDLGRSLS